MTPLTLTWVLILTLCPSFPCQQEVYTGFTSQEDCRATGERLVKEKQARAFDCVVESSKP